MPSDNPTGPIADIITNFIRATISEQSLSNLRFMAARIRPTEVASVTGHDDTGIIDVLCENGLVSCRLRLSEGASAALLAEPDASATTQAASVPDEVAQVSLKAIREAIADGVEAAVDADGDDVSWSPGFLTRKGAIEAFASAAAERVGKLLQSRNGLY